MYCKTCGSLLDDSDAVCSVCGTLVSKSQTADAAEVKDPVSEDPFRERSADQIVDPVPQEDGYRKFDFAWDNASFPTGEAKKIEDVEFKWNSEDLDSEKESLRETIGTAVREKEAEAVAVKRQEEATTVFEDDTFHFRPDPEEEARFHFNKKNEEFQELLDQEFEKIQERQTYIEEERNRINADVMKAEVETPASLISGDDVIKAAEERISGFLERADREMLEAIEQRVKDKIESLGIPETPEPEAFTLEPEPELVAGLESELEPEPEPVTEPESAPEAFTLEPEPEPVAGLESAPEPELESVPDTSASTIEEPTPPESPVVVAEPVPAEPLASKETPVAKEEPIFDDFVSGLYGENVAGLFSPLQSGAAEARTAGPDFIDSDFAALYADPAEITSAVAVGVPEKNPEAAPTTEELSKPGASVNTEELPKTETPITEELSKPEAPANAEELSKTEELPKTETPVNAKELPKNAWAEIEEALKIDVTREVNDALGLPAYHAVNEETALPDIVNEPIVFPFDPTPVSEPAAAPTSAPVAASELESEPEPTPASASAAADSSDLPDTTEELEGVDLSDLSDLPDAPDSSDSSGKSKKKKKKKKTSTGVIVFIDILVVIVVILLCAFAIMQFAPDSAIGEMLYKTAYSILHIFRG